NAGSSWRLGSGLRRRRKRVRHCSARNQGGASGGRWEGALHVVVARVVRSRRIGAVRRECSAREGRTRANELVVRSRQRPSRNCTVRTERGGRSPSRRPGCAADNGACRTRACSIGFCSSKTVG